MTSLLEAESTLTPRYQTTVPEAVRRALRLSKSEKLHYSLRDSGEVVISRTELAEQGDPVLAAFLSFLETDLQRHPERLKPVTQTTQRRIRQLTKGVTFDLNERLAADDADQ
jgi:antitoxin PrlF